METEKSIVTKDWYAWIDLMPPKPDYFHVEGKVEVSSSCVKAILVERIPQGMNQYIFQLDLELIQGTGICTPALKFVQARYDSVLPPGSIFFQQVEIYFENTRIAQMDVNLIH